MNKKKIIIGSIITVLVLSIIGFFSYFFFIKQDDNTALTLVDKQWIENNKNNIIPNPQYKTFNNFYSPFHKY